MCRFRCWLGSLEVRAGLYDGNYLVPIDMHHLVRYVSGQLSGGGASSCLHVIAKEEIPKDKHDSSQKRKTLFLRGLLGTA